ncbi:MAG TPA: alpha-glucosidase/alpha-galactosidase [Bacillota bacterium]|nr:alpha-glucosidase/alpha-galactosidase [Bacillota bacterium]
MKYSGGKVTELKIAYIGGGSRGWAWRLMADLALETDLAGRVALYDMDFPAAHANEVIGNKLSSRPEVKGKWDYKAVKTLEEALTGADAIILSILPGTFQEMASDVHLPEKYGIYQSVGDTTGPGGLLRALRTIPIYLEFAAKIKAYAPNAWVINYTNPMALCMRTLVEVFPEIKAFGCCHEVFGTQTLLTEILEKQQGLTGINRDEIKINVLGINHFTWIDQASYRGMDLFPVYREFVNHYYESGYEKEGKKNWQEDYFSSAQRVKFDLFRRFGLIAAAGDRHLAEFLPPWYYLKDPETVRSWKFSLTPVQWRIKNREELIAKSGRLQEGTEEFELSSSGEEGIRQIKALLGLGDLVTNVNLPNQGQMKGIPEKSVVETNALFSRDSVRPLLAGELPPEIQNLTMKHVLNYETILKAIMTEDREMAFRAFINDPLVTIDSGKARELFEGMLENTKEYLPGFLK